MEIRDYITYDQNFLEKETYRKLFKWIKSDLTWESAALVNEDGEKPSKNSKIRNVLEFNLNQHKTKNYTTAFWYDYLCWVFTKLSEAYFTEKNFIEKPIQSWFEITILKYESQHHYLFHHDYHWKMPRHLSYSLCLNDDYEGGELEFGFTKTDFEKIKMKKNSCILFPSNFMFSHRVHPVTKGTRYVIVGWMR